MKDLYANSFLAGVSVTLVGWFIVSIICFNLAKIEHEKTGISFSGSGSPFDWGFPFYWTDAGGFFANAVLVAFTSIVVGHIFRMVVTKYRSAKTE